MQENSQGGFDPSFPGNFEGGGMAYDQYPSDNSNNNNFPMNSYNPNINNMQQNSGQFGGPPQALYGMYPGQNNFPPNQNTQKTTPQPGFQQIPNQQQPSMGSSPNQATNSTGQPFHTIQDNMSNPSFANGPGTQNFNFALAQQPQNMSMPGDPSIQNSFDPQGNINGNTAQESMTTTTTTATGEDPTARPRKRPAAKIAVKSGNKAAAAAAAAAGGKEAGHKPRKRPAAKSLVKRVQRPNQPVLPPPTIPPVATNPPKKNVAKQPAAKVKTAAKPKKKKQAAADKKETTKKKTAAAKKTATPANKKAATPTSKKAATPTSKKAATPTSKKAATDGKTETTPKKRSYGGNSHVWEGKPDEPLAGGWPDGWVKRIFERKNGATAGGRDRYWYTPKKAYKLRSMVEVRKFMVALALAGGDEDEAKRKFKSVKL